MGIFVFNSIESNHVYFLLKMPEKSLHPTYIEMIDIAFKNVKDRKGISRQKIAKYINENFQGLNNSKMHISKNLKRAIELGMIEVKTGNGLSGRFKLVKSLKPAKIEKDKKTKNPDKPKTVKKKAVTKKTPIKKVAAIKKAAIRATKKPKSPVKSVKKDKSKMDTDVKKVKEPKKVKEQKKAKETKKAKDTKKVKETKKAKISK